MQVKLALWPGAIDGQVAATDPGGQNDPARQPAQTSTGTWNHGVVKLIWEARTP